MTHREFDALSGVHRGHIRRWAIARAQVSNAWLRGKDDAPYLPDDFMGTGNRSQRQKEIRQSRYAAQMANAELAKIRPGEAPEDLPDWAKPRPGEIPS